MIYTHDLCELRGKMESDLIERFLWNGVSGVEVGGKGLIEVLVGTGRPAEAVSNAVQLQGVVLHCFSQFVFLFFFELSGKIGFA